MRIIGLDIHRAFAEAVAWDEGELKRLGRVDMRRHLLEAFAKKLSKEDVEPLRVDRRLFRLNHAAMAGSFSMA